MKTIKETEAYFSESQLTVENYQLKILTMIAVLAENHLAFDGTLKDMCSFLGVSYQNTNTKKIKNAIDLLAEQNYILVVKQGRIWTLTLTLESRKKNKILKIQKAWVDAIKEYKSVDPSISVDWINILKVLIYLMADIREVKQYATIAKALNISVVQVKNAVKALDNIKLNDIIVERKLSWFKDFNGDFKVNGQKFSVGYDFRQKQ